MLRARSAFIEQRMGRLLLHFVLGVNDVFIFLLLGRPTIGLSFRRRTGPGSAARRCAGLAALLLVHLFSKLVAHVREVLHRLLDGIGVVGLERIFQRVDRAFDVPANVG